LVTGPTGSGKTTTLYAALNLAAAPLSRMAPRLVQKLGRRALFWGMPLLLCASMLAMAWSATAALEQPESARGFAWLGIAMFFLQQIPFGVHWGLVQEFVNHRIQPEARSTVWSVLSLGGRLVYSPINMGLFAVQQASGLPLAMLLCGGAGAALTAIVMWMRPRGLLRGQKVSGPGR
jgi:MFS family permease